MILFFLSPEGFHEFCDQLVRIIDIAAAGCNFIRVLESSTTDEPTEETSYEK
jgi:hypothetical protein